MVPGCGVVNYGSFTAESGLIGLNRDAYSLAMQTASTYSQVFTYCLADIIARPNDTSRLSFGIRDESNSNMEYTPMMGTELYYLNLSGITIGSSELPITPTAFRIAVGLLWRRNSGFRNYSHVFGGSSIHDVLRDLHRIHGIEHRWIFCHE